MIDEGRPAPVEPATTPVVPETMKGPWTEDTASLGVSDGSGDRTADELAGTMTDGKLPVGASGVAEDLKSGVGVGWTAEEGIGLPVPMMPPRSVESRPPAFSLGVGVGCAEGDASGDGVGCTIEDGRPTDGPAGGVLEGTTSGSSGLGVGVRTVEDCADDAGGGDGKRWLPVPEGGDGGGGSPLFWSGTGVTMTSLMEVTVLVALSASLLLTTTELEDSLGFTRGSSTEERSSCRDSICWDELDDDESVAAAGAVELVTICLFTCRGK